MATITVTTLTDENDGGSGGTGLSLREAIIQANANGVADTIDFQPGLTGTITPFPSLPALSSEIIIDGDTDNDGKADITISGATFFRIFEVSAGGTVTLRSLSLTAGRSDSGGAILVDAGGTLSVVNTTLSGNFGTVGGAIHSAGTLTVVNSAIHGNSADDGGGGVFVAAGSTATFINSTIDSNSSVGAGGGIAAGVGATLNVLNSTIVTNTSEGLGGGIHLAANADLTIKNSVVAANDGGAEPDIGTTGSGANVDSTGSFFGTSFNISGSSSGDQVGGDPLLGPLTDNGGPVQTRAPQDGSPLIGAGFASALPLDTLDLDGDASTTEPLPLDATGAPRVLGTLDIGAVESRLELVVTTAIDVVDGNDGLLSLREAIALANDAPDASTITFASGLAGQTITLNGTFLDIYDDVTINGDTNGDRKADITISGNDASRVFEISGASTDVVLRSLTLTDGFDGIQGGAIVAGGGAGATLKVIDSTIKDSSTGSSGGAINSGVTLTIANSLITGNTADFGGGVMAFGTSVTIVNSTIHGNNATTDGGGIDTGTGTTVTIDSSTITNNTAGGIGGGLDLYNSSNATVRNSVFSGNTAATGADIGETGSSSTLNAFNSFFGTTVNIAGTFTATQDGGGDPLLGALADNGGPVLTRSPLNGSPLIGAGNAALRPADTHDIDGDGNTTELLPLDAAGNARIIGTLDIGAVEFAPPVITSNGGSAMAAISKAENATAVTTVTASDPTGQARTFSISGGADAGKFTINPTTGVLTFASAPNFEAPTDNGGNNVYDVTVRATDTSDHFDDQAIKITITNVNEGIAITSNGGGASAAISVGENGTAVTTVTAADIDASDTKTFSISGGADRALFTINASTGALTFRSVPNFEAPTDAGRNTVYDVIVRVADAGGLSDTQALAVRVTNVNERPTDVKLSKGSVAESLKAGTLVGALSVVDPDGSTASFKLTKNPDGFFKIVGNTLQTAKKLDFEKLKSHVLTIEATDPGGLKTSKAFTIKVADVVDIVTGTSKKDTLTGAKGVDKISGLGGKDKVFGKGAKDTLDGGDGNDMLVGGSGGDALRGGKGVDTASYEDAATKVTANLKAASKNKGDASGDSYASIENLTGSDFSDTLTGNDGANTIRGGKGNDKIAGGRGADTLFGNSGDDRFIFKALADSTAKKAGRDIIADFSPGDLIDVSGIDAKAASKKSNQKFAFIGTDAFSNTDGELRFEQAGRKTFVYGDTDGDGAADLAIELTGTVNLKESDFLL